MADLENQKYFRFQRQNTFEKDNGNTFEKVWQILKTENTSDERNDRRRRKNIYEEGIENAVILFPADWLGLECLNISIVAISSLCVQI